MKNSKILLFALLMISCVPLIRAELPADSVPFEKLSPRDALEKFSKQINPARSAAEMMVGDFYFKDINEHYGIHVAFGGAEFSEGKPQNPDFTVSISDRIWQNVVLGKISILDAITTEGPDVSVVGSKVIFLKFLALFDKTPDTKVRRY